MVVAVVVAVASFVCTLGRSIRLFKDDGEIKKKIKTFIFFFFIHSSLLFVYWEKNVTYILI